MEEGPALRAGGCSGQPGLGIRGTLAQSREVAAALQMALWLRPSPFTAHPSLMRKTDSFLQNRFCKTNFVGRDFTEIQHQPQ